MQSSESSYVHINQLLETDPVVAMDVSVGKGLNAGEVVGVDYEALRKTLKAVGAPKDTSELTITLGQVPTTIMPGAKGTYFPDKQSVRLKWSGEKSTQRSLQHELRHYTDMRTRPVTKREVTRQAVGYHGTRAAIRALPIALGVQAAGLTEAIIETDNPLMQAAEQLNSVGSLGFIALYAVGSAFMATYAFNRREYTAGKAEMLKLDPVFTKTTS